VAVKDVAQVSILHQGETRVLMGSGDSSRSSSNISDSKSSEKISEKWDG
jgi:hypothetical protein